MSSFECESCQLSKHFRASYTHLDSIPSKSLFDLVHCNVWGPSRVASILVLRYYIVFVYDFSRASWVYLFKYRTDVLPSIHQFLQEISNQYSNTPKILGTDNALEFVQTALQDLCISHGILHQSTCPHTSQQNGVAERKHRHLLDMTLILLVEMGVPHFLWSDALHTYTYLLNGLPSSLLGGEVPFVVSTLIVTFLLCLLGCLVVWPSFMIILVIHSSWRPIMSKGCSSTTRAHKKAIGSIFQINASMLSLLMSHSSSLLPFSPPPPYLLPLQHHLHPLYLPHPLRPLQRTHLIYLLRWILLLNYHYLHHHLLPLYLTLLLLHYSCHPWRHQFRSILQSPHFRSPTPQPRVQIWRPLHCHQMIFTYISILAKISALALFTLFHTF